MMAETTVDEAIPSPTVGYELEKALLEEVSFHRISLKFTSARCEQIYQRKRNVQRRKFYPILLAYVAIHAVLQGLENNDEPFILYFNLGFIGALYSCLYAKQNNFRMKTRRFTLIFYVLIGIWFSMAEVLYLLVCVVTKGMITDSFYYCYPLLIGIILDISFPVMLFVQVMFSVVVAFSIMLVSAPQTMPLLLCNLALNTAVTVGGSYSMLRFARHSFVDLVLFKREKVARLKQKMALNEAVVAAKKNYIATVAHDIGTPITAFLTCLEALRETRLSREQQNLLFTAECAVELLQVTRKDALDGNLTQDVHLVPKMQKVNLMDLLVKCAKVLNIAGSYSDLPIEVYRDPMLPSFLITDYDWAWSMILVLLRNARKYGQQGVIKVFIFLTKDGQRVRLEVADQGFGIPKDKRHLLFKPFSKLNKNDLAGLGLGLWSLYKKAKSLEGQVGMRDNLLSARGSNFWFEIPVKPANDSMTLSSSEEAYGSITQLPATMQSFSDKSNDHVLLVGAWNLNEKGMFKEYLKQHNLTIEEEPVQCDAWPSPPIKHYGMVLWLLDNDAPTSAEQLQMMHNDISQHYSSKLDPGKEPPMILLFTKQCTEEVNQDVVEKTADSKEPSPFHQSVRNLEEKSEQSSPENEKQRVDTPNRTFLSFLSTLSPKKGQSLLPLLSPKRRPVTLPYEAPVSTAVDKREKDIKRGSRRLHSSLSLFSESQKRDYFFPELPQHNILDEMKASGGNYSSRAEASRLNSGFTSEGLPTGPFPEIFMKPVCDADLINLIMCYQPYYGAHVVDLDTSIDKTLSGSFTYDSLMTRKQKYRNTSSFTRATPESFVLGQETSPHSLQHLGLPRGSGRMDKISQDYRHQHSTSGEYNSTFTSLLNESFEGILSLSHSIDDDNEDQCTDIKSVSEQYSVKSQNSSRRFSARGREINLPELKITSRVINSARNWSGRSDNSARSTLKSFNPFTQQNPTGRSDDSARSTARKLYSSRVLSGKSLHSPSVDSKHADGLVLALHKREGNASLTKKNSTVAVAGKIPSKRSPKHQDVGYGEVFHINDHPETKSAHLERDPYGFGHPDSFEETFVEPDFPTQLKKGSPLNREFHQTTQGKGEGPDATISRGRHTHTVPRERKPLMVQTKSKSRICIIDTTTQTDAKGVNEAKIESSEDKSQDELKLKENVKAKPVVKDVKAKIESSEDKTQHESRLKENVKAKPAVKDMKESGEVLVVDDDKITVKMTTRMLSRKLFSVEVAENGRVGLEKMKGKIYRFVLMDWNMPVMDGLKCIERFREWEKGEMEQGTRKSKQNIVMFSANAAEHFVQRALEGGADAFIAKPIKIKNILDVISSVEAKQTEKSVEPQAIEKVG